MEQKYLTVAEYSEKLGKDKQLITRFARLGKIEGAKKFANIWLIPENATITDGRVKSGKYKNWRKKSN